MEVETVDIVTELRKQISVLISQKEALAKLVAIQNTDRKIMLATLRLFANAENWLFDYLGDSNPLWNEAKGGSFPEKIAQKVIEAVE